MKQRIMNHASILVVLSVLLTFIAASAVMYERLNNYMRQGVRDEALYIRAAMEQVGDRFLTEEIGSLTSSRITLLDADGEVLYDSNADVEELKNHSDRPEIQEAFADGEAEEVRYSETLSERTYYYALCLEDGKILRVARTAESAVLTLLSSFTLLGGLVVVILVLEFFLVQKQTKDLIAPINELDLENPLKEVRYEELRPLLMRVDKQNKQIASQVEELKAAEAMRREFSANVSHELKTPLMSISGYAELMMNGMVRPEDVPEFSGRIYHEATRLSSLVADIIQLSRMDGAASDMPFENVDICELGEDIVTHLTPAADKKHISLSFSGRKPRFAECGRFSMRCFTIWQTMPSAIRTRAVRSALPLGIQGITFFIRYVTMELEFPKKSRGGFLSVSIVWTRAIPGKPAVPVLGFPL